MKSNHLLQVENLDHLGLVAGIIDDIGIVEQINRPLALIRRWGTMGSEIR
jgi:hypothetical protein